MLIATMAVSLSACGGNKDDWSAIKKEGVLTIGITFYEPMNYKDSTGKLIGFDTEFAEAVCQKLGIRANFVEIDWDNKVVELKAKNIDVVWNGMTLKDELKPNMDFSQAYMDNSQCVVVKKANLAQYANSESCTGKTAAAENGSAGKAEAGKLTTSVTGVAKQTDALLEVKAGSSDFAVIDILMAEKLVGTGDYQDLAIATNIKLASEQYGVGLRKGSTLTAKINEAINALLAEGKLQQIATKYNLSNALITSQN